MAQTYVYKATVANDQIQGINIGSNGDESCSIAATTKSNSWFTPYEKQEAGKVAYDFTLITAVAGLIVEGCAAGIIVAPACAIPVGAFGAANALVAALAGTVQQDPTDHNYKRLAKVVYPSIPISFGTSVPDRIRRASSSFILNGEHQAGLWNALYTTTNRAATAHASGDQLWEKVQTDYARSLKQRIAFATALSIRYSEDLSASVVGTQYDIEVTPAEMLAFERQLAAGQALPSQIAAPMSQFGLTKDMISTVEQTIMATNTEAVAGFLSSSWINSTSIDDDLSAVSVYGGGCDAVYLVVASLGTKLGDPGFIQAADLNGDGVIDMRDFAMAMKRAGSRAPLCVGSVL